MRKSCCEWIEGGGRGEGVGGYNWLWSAVMAKSLTARVRSHTRTQPRTYHHSKGCHFNKLDIRNTTFFSLSLSFSLFFPSFFNKISHSRWNKQLIGSFAFVYFHIFIRLTLRLLFVAFSNCDLGGNDKQQLIWKYPTKKSLENRKVNNKLNETMVNNQSKQKM